MTEYQQSAPPIAVNVDGRRKFFKVKFDHKWKGADGSWQSGDIIVDPGTPEHEIVFEVDPNSPKKLRFVDDPNEAIWVRPGTCPTSSCNEGGQITPLRVEANGTRLRVRNANTGEPTELHYMLRFKRSLPVVGPYEYDPVIRNGGGEG